jgi:hypothetical protein
LHIDRRGFDWPGSTIDPANFLFCDKILTKVRTKTLMTAQFSHLAGGKRVCFQINPTLRGARAGRDFQWPKTVRRAAVAEAIGEMCVLTR